MVSAAGCTQSPAGLSPSRYVRFRRHCTAAGPAEVDGVGDRMFSAIWHSLSRVSVPGQVAGTVFFSKRIIQYPAPGPPGKGRWVPGHPAGCKMSFQSGTWVFIRTQKKPAVRPARQFQLPLQSTSPVTRRYGGVQQNHAPALPALQPAPPARVEMLSQPAPAGINPPQTSAAALNPGQNRLPSPRRASGCNPAGKTSQRPLAAARRMARNPIVRPAAKSAPLSLTPAPAPARSRQNFPGADHA